MKIALIVALILFPLALNAGHFYVYNYDPVDRFYDPQVGDSVDCSYWVTQYLTALGHTYVAGTALPTNLNPYDAVFVLLGWFRC